MLNIFKTLTNSSLKLRNYFDIYELNFNRFKNKNPVILEIGVRGGGGIELLYKYFNGNCEIYGVDIDPQVLQINKTYPNIKIFLGDQANKDFMESVAKEIGKPIDIILDDGGHCMHQQINSFEALFPYVNEDGVYLIEDVGTSFNPIFNNRSTKTLINYMKDITDGLTDFNNINYKNYFKNNLFSICFYSEIITIHKKKRINFEFLSSSLKYGYKEKVKLDDKQNCTENIFN